MDWKQFLFGTDSLPDGTKVTHERLGEMVFEDPFWRGHVAVGDKDLEIFIDEDRECVDEVLAEYCLSILPNFERLVGDARDLISLEMKISRSETLARFTPTDLWGFYKSEKVRNFNISFSDRDNEFAFWFVEFENEIAVQAGCDT